ncbi:MAG: galactose oxidase, partial [Bacteroides sp.]|nr:galactose oxidase [Bacteroides sp.]
TDRYNLLSGEWKQLANLPEEISYPALATDGSFIYMYTSGKIYTYNIKTGFLERYYIALNVVDPGLLYWSNKLYIIGGCMRPANYVFPLREVYVVDTSKMK